MRRTHKFRSIRLLALAGGALACLVARSAAEETTATLPVADGGTTATASAASQAQRLGNLLTQLDQTSTGLPGTPAGPGTAPEKISATVPPTDATNATSGTVAPLKMVVHRPDHDGVDLQLLLTSATTPTTATQAATTTTRDMLTMSSATIAALARATTTPTPTASPTPTPLPRTTNSTLLGARATATPAPAAVHVNSASEKELAAGLHLDERRARLIVEFRQLYGKFNSPDDLDQVTGIPDDLVRQWEEAGLLKFD